MPQTPPIHLLNGESSFGGFTKLDIGDALALALPVLVDLHALHLECTPSTGQDNFSFPTSPNVLKASLKSSSSTDFPQTMKSREFGGTLSFLLVSVIAVQPNDKRAQRFTFWYPILRRSPQVWKIQDKDYNMDNNANKGGITSTGGPTTWWCYKTQDTKH